MAGAKEIKTKISSVKSTQKITKAMEMVATSKMRKTQDRMAASRPYSEAIRNVISHVSKIIFFGIFTFFYILLYSEIYEIFCIVKNILKRNAF